MCLAAAVGLTAVSTLAVASDAGRVVALDAQNKVQAEAYTVEMKASGGYQAGKEGTVELTLASKTGYHVNEKYPIKFKLSDPAPEGVSYPKAVLKRDDASCDAARCTFQVPFVPARAGKAKVTGVFAFSVCSDASCIMDRLELELAVDVN
ncbi:MAG: hypothetical protein IT373_28310 [Polyangiaceae bacterium]|nr:hypothetical protein [Polyangiaceae bacterium]